MHKWSQALIQPRRTGRGWVEAKGKGWVKARGLHHTLPPCVTLLSIKRCVQILFECVAETPQTWNSVIPTTSAICTNTFIRQHIWRTTKCQHNRSAHLPTSVSIATASITLHHAACPLLWPTRLLKPPHYLQDLAHSSSKPRREQIWFLLSGGSLIQLLHITRMRGRDCRVAVRVVNVKLWKEGQRNVRICFAAFAELIFGRALFNCSA